MNRPDFPPEVIEKAARTLYIEAEKRSMFDGWGEWDSLSPGSATCEAFRDIARPVLAAVADDLRAEGARAEAALWQAQVRGHDRSGVMALDREAAYQRGMVEGARQVLAGVEALADDWSRIAIQGVDLAPREYAEDLRAYTREAVARIETED